MKYARERRFLENLNIASIYFDEFLTFNVLNDIEKKIMYYVFRKRRSIRNIANLSLLNYEKSQLYKFVHTLLTSHLRGFFILQKKIHLLQGGL